MIPKKVKPFKWLCRSSCEIVGLGRDDKGPYYRMILATKFRLRMLERDAAILVE